MSVLKVFLQGQEIASLELVSGTEYTIGRGSQCDVVLPPQKAISRSHLKVSDYNGQWKVELTSKFSNLYNEGEEVQSIELSEGSKFSVPPFEFSLEAALSESASKDAPLASENADLMMDSDSQPHFEPVDSFNNINAQPVAANVDHTSGGATRVARLPLVPHLRILNTENNTEETFKLEGSSWIIGRHPASEVCVTDSAISRKHFEIGRTEYGFTIRDLGSSNGLELNGTALPPMKATNLVSGDELVIRHLKMFFELRDPAFQHRVKDLAPLDSYSVVNHNPEYGLEAVMSDSSGPGVVRVDNKSAFSAKLNDPKTRKILMFTAPLLLVFALIFGGGDDKGGGKVDLNSENAAPPSAEALAEAKHLFELAKNHYQSGKYEFCLAQIDKLHNIVPTYESSKDIENLCRQGLELDRINVDRERKERERLEAENLIKGVVENCKSQVDKFKSVADTEACLADAIERSPENPEVLALIEQVRSREEQEREIVEKAEARERRKSQGLSKYKTAMSYVQSGNTQRALSELRKFLSGNYGLSSEESNARNAIRDLEQKLTAEAQESIKACNESLSSEKYKDALIACEKALKIDPRNQQAEELKSRSLANLNRNMKSLYEDSILEESLGNLDAAKEKWARIVKDSVPDDSYYKKAKSKLKKYGVGF